VWGGEVVRFMRDQIRAERKWISRLKRKLLLKNPGHKGKGASMDFSSSRQWINALWILFACTGSSRAQAEENQEARTWSNASAMCSSRDRFVLLARPEARYGWLVRALFRKPRVEWLGVLLTAAGVLSHVGALASRFQLERSRHSEGRARLNPHRSVRAIRHRFIRESARSPWDRDSHG